MSRVEQFEAYAAAFEEAFASDDWSVVEPFFTEDAVYETLADPPFGGRHAGRQALLAHLKQSLDGFDRRFESRELELLEGPVERDDGVWIRWRATYRTTGAPALSMEGEETASFEGDRIRRLEDRFTPESSRQVLAWLGEHGAKLASPA